METLIGPIAAAVTMRTLYPESHPRIGQAIAQIRAALAGKLEVSERDSVTFLIVGDDLVADEQILRKATLSQRQFVQLLQRRGIERLTLAEGISEEELLAVVTALAVGNP